MTQPANMGNRPKVGSAQPLELGEVYFQGRSYKAILHFDGADGQPLVTSQMDQSRQCYIQTIQSMLDCSTFTAADSDSLLSRVSMEGFAFVQDEDVNHATLLDHASAKTEAMWEKFLFILQNPASAPYLQSTNEIISAEDVQSEEWRTFSKSMHQKILSAFSSPNLPIQLSEDEKRWLKKMGYSDLAEGVFNANTQATRWINLATMLNTQVSS